MNLKRGDKLKQYNIKLVIPLLIISLLLSSCGSNNTEVNNSDTNSNDVTSLMQGYNKDNKIQDDTGLSTDNQLNDSESEDKEVDLGKLTNTDSSNNQDEQEDGNDTNNKDDKLDINSELGSLLQVKMIDCGQADSILLHTDKYNILIDAGEQKSATAIKKAIDNLGIKKIDLLIGTHPHSDHIGGMQTIVESYDIGTVMMYPTEHSTQTYTKLLEAISNKGCDTIKATPGNEYNYGDIKITVLGPSKTYDDLNDNSVVVLASFGDIDVLLTGDAGMESEKDYIEYIPGEVEILKVGHHGSETATSDNLLDTINPEMALISCGEDNKYGHPTQEVLDKLSKRGIDTFRTDLLGDITITTNGKQYTIETEKYGEVKIDNTDGTYTKPFETGNTQNEVNENQDSNSGNENTAITSSSSNREVYVAQNGKKYHSTNTCKSLFVARSINTITEAEAISNGMEKCKNCWSD